MEPHKIKVQKLIELLSATVGDWDVTQNSEGLTILNGDKAVGEIDFTKGVLVSLPSDDEA